ncbi:UDP-N-acetylmuramate:L-alanyl-gamma-D-glutamyl-meso-diaminopimelate ligase [Halopseudomonas pelagia]|uniref:UDP-N-acetylmuramate:L-alanyl-gamma-D-glutamyl- meso-diaminopimelate ligase n=1 Tax=Halopseudomonas pelagia TaxID=553151 RepID=UPI0030DC7165|tara:strand:- start:186853 stop:188217 length:1365 start_codon:yes stop_codon:yes gene_type:complete
MHLHILGICGTFMGSLALLARELGHQVSGSDANVYPPMSTQLEAQGIALMEGYYPAHLQPAPDLVVIGNALSRGNPAVEYVLDQGLPYVSGPEWLSRYVLPERWVLAVAGTHGKTTTSSLLAWILECAGMAPGFLIGGVPQNFGVSARLGTTPFFVVEADEYDSAFFDKRSKFVHYRPRTAVLNNLEYDHADIFPDLAAIERQFHHLVRTVPASGLIIYPKAEVALERVIAMGCWTPCQTTGEGGQWQARLLAADGSRFEVWLDGVCQGEARWSQTGDHSVANALTALAAARHVGVTPAQGIAALAQFQSAKRRMELLALINGVSVYDDFAHHPTAISTTLAGLRASIGDAPLIAVIEPRSNTMRLGSHSQALAASVSDATQVIWFQPPGLDWSLQAVVEQSRVPASIDTDIDGIISSLLAEAKPGTRIVFMSNGGFGGIHQRLIQALEVQCDD